MNLIGGMFTLCALRNSKELCGSTVSVCISTLCAVIPPQHVVGLVKVLVTSWPFCALELQERNLSW